jgi:hypothetical protein
LAFATGAQLAFALATFRVSVSGVPARSSRMSLRKMSARDGYGPIVSFGVTAHAALPPVVGVVVDVPDEGLVTESVPQPNATADPAAPMMAMASRLVSLFFT